MPKDEATHASEAPLEKRVRNPDAPKRPLTAFFYFSNSIRKRLQSENPTVPLGQLSKRIADMWRDLPKEQKKVRPIPCAQLAGSCAAAPARAFRE